MISVQQDLAAAINGARQQGETWPSALARVVLNRLLVRDLAAKVGSESRLADFVYEQERVSSLPPDMLASAIVRRFGLDGEAR